MLNLHFSLAFLAIGLSAFAQAPADPPQPNQNSYSAAELQQFPTYTRDSYRAKFGAPAPACDASRLVKSWFDRTVDATRPEDFVIYKVVSPDGKLKQMVMTNLEASAVNLTGVEKYPPYQADDTQALLHNPVSNQAIGTIWPQSLSTLDQAKRFAALFNGTYSEDSGAPNYTYSYPSTEPRRVWTVKDASGNMYLVGQLLYEENSAGIGAPGSWSVSNGTWKWSAAPLSDCAGQTERPVPVRALLPNEQLTTDPFGGVQVIRTDLKQTLDESTGRFTDADRKLLQAIAAKLGVQQ